MTGIGMHSSPEVSLVDGLWLLMRGQLALLSTFHEDAINGGNGRKWQPVFRGAVQPR